MATIKAAANGNFADGATWTGGVAPGIGDVAVANNKTITVAADAQCDEVRNDTTGGATAGGTFSLNNGVTLTADVYAGGATGQCVTFALATPNTAAVIGAVTGGSIAGGYGISVSSTGTLTVTGTITGGSGGHGIYSAHANVLNVVGNVVAGSVAAIRNNGGGTLNITGNVTGGATYALYLSNTGGAAITGNVTGGSSNNGWGIYSSNSGSITVNGDVTGGSGSQSHGIYSAGGAGITVTGTCQGGAGPGLEAWAINVVTAASTGTVVDCIATLYGGGVRLLPYSTSLSAWVVTGDVTGNDWIHTDAAGGGYAGFEVCGRCRVTVLGTITNGANGQVAVAGTIIRDVDNPIEELVIPYIDTGTLEPSSATLYLPGVPDGLLASDLRAGVSLYGGGLIGTLAVPPPASVALGVPTDATVGLAALTPASVWDHLKAAILTPGSVGEKLKRLGSREW